MRDSISLSSFPEKGKRRTDVRKDDLISTRIASPPLQQTAIPSRTPAIRQADGPLLPQRTLFVHLQPDQPQKWHHTVLLTDRWRLVSGKELYDIEADRGQQNDVAAQHADVVQVLLEHGAD